MTSLLSNLLLAQATRPVMPPVAPTGGDLWFPPQASVQSANTDAIFYFIYWISVFFFALIVVLMVAFVLRYRRREGVRAEGKAAHNTPLELTWSIIPLILVVIMFYGGYRGFLDITSPPADALEIAVTGQKWNWFFRYPNGLQTNELHVPVDTNVRLVLSSTDVIHSLFIPAFRLKRDAVPGRYNKIWFKATTPGEYLALCAEYCGTQHSDMQARVVVHVRGEYEVWLEKESNPFERDGQLVPLAEVGAKLYARKGCAGCHSLDGTRITGPSLQGVFGEPVKFRDGSSGVVDEYYIRESLEYPQAKIVQGYDPVMPSYKGQLKDREIEALIEFIKSRK